MNQENSGSGLIEVSANIAQKAQEMQVSWLGRVAKQRFGSLFLDIATRPISSSEKTIALETAAEQEIAKLRVYYVYILSQKPMAVTKKNH